MPHSTIPTDLVSKGIAEYLIITSTEDDYHASYHHFAEKVNRKLKAGYLLYGQPFNVNQTLCQAVILPFGVTAGNDTAVFVQKPSGFHS